MLFKKKSEYILYETNNQTYSIQLDSKLIRKKCIRKEYIYYLNYDR